MAIASHADATVDHVPLERARAVSLASVAPLDVEDVPLLDALGRAPVAAMRATEDLVPFARSAMDGYAVRAADAFAGARLPIIAHVVAGDAIARQRAGTSIAIATGAPLPDGADAVAKWEDVDLAGAAIRCRITVQPGENVFPPGEDARCGDVLAPAGRALDPGALALLAAAGYGRVAVRRRPRVAVLSTGDELVEPGVPPRGGQVADSNGVLLEALLRAAGADIVRRERCADDVACVKRALADAAVDADLVITSGGASHGPRDAVKPALTALGARFAFTSVALRPAKPTAFARLGTTAVLVLPGNPSAAFVAYLLFAQPLLARFAGIAPPSPLGARLSGKVHAHPSRNCALIVTVGREPEGFVARVLANQCSSLAGNAARADGIVVLPPGTAAYADGATVVVEPVGNRAGV